MNINAESYDGCTALHLAVMEDLDDFCAMLISYGANPTAANYVGDSVSRPLDDSDDLEEEEEESEDDISSENEKGGLSPIDLAQSKELVSYSLIK